MKLFIEEIPKELSSFVQEMEVTKEHDGAIQIEVVITEDNYYYNCHISNKETVAASGKTMAEAYWRAVVKYESQP